MADVQEGNYEGALVHYGSVASGASAFSGKSIAVLTAVNGGAGICAVTLAGGGIDATDRIVMVHLHSGVSGFCSFVQTSDTVIGVRTFSAAGAAADRGFNVKVYRRGIG